MLCIDYIDASKRGLEVLSFVIVRSDIKRRKNIVVTLSSYIFEKDT